jgi:hypothetical protein
MIRTRRAAREPKSVPRFFPRDKREKRGCAEIMRNQDSKSKERWRFALQATALSLLWLAANQQTAKVLGIMIPPALPARA